MKKDDIITLPHEHLRQRSKRVGVLSEEIKRLIEDMKAATLDWEDSRDHEVGVALAAIQVDRPYRIVIVRNNFDDKQDRSFSVFINPEIAKFEGELIDDFEGCLSVKDIYGKVPRYQKVKVKALNENGQEIRVTAEGFLARIFQHEIDHINGKVFIDHIKDKPDGFFKLMEDGQLEKLDYEKQVKGNDGLWG
ncbi:MAG: peptide deformylase [Candidatus Saccharibacteria bacterium]|nr:peptide deformylase [Candidatus Saccharibacteria bacterium]